MGDKDRVRVIVIWGRLYARRDFCRKPKNDRQNALNGEEGQPICGLEQCRGRGGGGGGEKRRLNTHAMSSN